MDKLEIVRISTENYHLYDDMVFWRINKRERSIEEKNVAKCNIDVGTLSELNNDNFYVYAAELNGKYVGWIHVVYIPKIGSWSRGILCIDELWVTPEYRNKGIAHELCERANKLLVEINADRIRLYTNNPTAQRVYEKCGWYVSNECVFMESRRP